MRGHACAFEGGGRKKLKLVKYQAGMIFPNGVREGDRIVKAAGEDGYHIEDRAS